MDWLPLTASSAETRFALWAIAGVTLTTLVLFVYTMSLRIATIRGARRQRQLALQWRDLFAAAVMDGDAVDDLELPRIARRDRINLLEEWDRTQLAVDGEAAENLNLLARRADLDNVAALAFHSRRLSEKLLAIQALGHLREWPYREEVAALIDDENTVLSITAALALVEIDPDRAVRMVVPKINARRDWPRTQVSLFLRRAGSERVSEPLYRALRSADNAGTTYLLQFAGLVDTEVLDALVVELIRESKDPGVLNAALKHVSGFAGIPRLAELAQHQAWFVRMQAAKVLGRFGEREHIGLLEELLGDQEWWVRYRAAQALVTLPFMGPNRLRQVRDRQIDNFGRDILEQAMAEVGLA